MPTINIPKVQKKNSPNDDQVNDLDQNSQRNNISDDRDSQNTDAQPSNQALQPPPTPRKVKNDNSPHGQNDTHNSNQVGKSWGGANSDSWMNPWTSRSQDKPKSSQSKPKMSIEERVQMIKKVFSEVLGREPDTRDINYYKYSTLGEDEIRKQLINGKEHNQLVNEGREYKKIKRSLDEAETRVKVLEGQLKDQLQEFRELTNLLEEKNRFIKQLRQELNLDYGFNTKKVKATTELENSQATNTNIDSSSNRESSNSSQDTNSNSSEQREFTAPNSPDSPKNSRENNGSRGFRESYSGTKDMIERIKSIIFPEQ